MKEIKLRIEIHILNFIRHKISFHLEFLSAVQKPFRPNFLLNRPRGATTTSSESSQLSELFFSSQSSTTTILTLSGLHPLHGGLTVTGAGVTGAAVGWVGLIVWLGKGGA